MTKKLAVCQSSKREGYTTIDRAGGVGVDQHPDIYFDLHRVPPYSLYLGGAIENKPWYDESILSQGEMLPFAEDMFDEILSEHTLEHIRPEKFVDVIIELWRISKDGAIWHIYVPYATNTLDTANPYHFMKFNERTFEFFYQLAGSANEKFVPWLIPVRIQLQHIFPAFQHMEPEVRKEDVETQFNVAQDIYYMLRVAKTTVEPWAELSKIFKVEY